MVRLICDRKMRLGALLLLAGVPSEPMSEAAALALIDEPRAKLARLWHAGGVLRIVPSDQDAEATKRESEERLQAAARAAFEALHAAEDPERAKDLLEQLWRRNGVTIDTVARVIEQTESLIESLSDRDRARLMELVERRRARMPDDAGESDESGGEGSNGAGEPPAPPAPPAPPGPPAPPVPMDKLTIPQAAPVIAAETDIELLQAWRETDDRKGIHELIDTRLEELTRPPE